MEIIGYTYELYYDSTLLTESEEVFDTEDEAREDAESEINSRIEMWDSDGAWNGDDNRCYFDIVINEVTE